MEREKAIFAKYLELTPERYLLLVALQKLLVINDILFTGAAKKTSKDEPKLKEKKEKWCEEWEAAICDGLKTTRTAQTEREILISFEKLPKHLQVLMLLEAHAFVPYFAISERGSGVSKRQAFTEESRRQWAVRLEMFTGHSNFDKAALEKIIASYNGAVKEIPGTDWKSIARNLTIIAGSAAVLGITGGVAAPWVGGLIGATFFGLSGAAATSAGLAFLGGGAIATGGFGVAGGTAILVGGGALLGSLFGKTQTKKEAASKDKIGSAELSSFDTNFLIVQSAKIETIARTAVAAEDLDDFVRAVLRDYRVNIQKLDSMIGLGNSLKKAFPKLERDTLVRNRRILENAAKRVREIF